MKIRTWTAAVLALLPAGCAGRGYGPYVEDFEKERVYLPGMHVHDDFCRHEPEDPMARAAVLHEAGVTLPRSSGAAYPP